jgi:hypothetical protein
VITIFNGRTRRLGGDYADDIYVQVSVALRDHLHLLKGAPLAVFLAVALHSDKDGWSHPGRRLLAKETGYNEQTVSAALSHLDILTIEGHRVLLIVQERNDASRFVNNHYLIFPTPEDIAFWEARGVTRRSRLPCMENTHTGEKPSIGFPYTDDATGRSTISKKIQDMESSSSDDDDDVLREIDGLTRSEALLLRLGASTKAAYEFRDVSADAIEVFVEKRLKGHPRDEWAAHMGSVVTAMRRLGKQRIADDYERHLHPWRNLNT